MFGLDKKTAGWLWQTIRSAHTVFASVWLKRIASTVVNTVKTRKTLE